MAICFNRPTDTLEPIENTEITREHYKAMARLGFVPHYYNGRIWFTARSNYEKLVASGRLELGSSVQ